MGTSFVELAGAGFWARDASLSQWLPCLVDEIDRTSGCEAWLKALREHWHTQGISRPPGCIDTGLSCLSRRRPDSGWLREAQPNRESVRSWSGARGLFPIRASERRPLY